MANKYNSTRYRLSAAIFLLSTLLLVFVLIPPFWGLSSIPEWMTYSRLGLGAISVLTVPFAWRWLYLRERKAD